MQKQISSKLIALTFGVLAISFLAAFYAVAWTEPTQNPPDGNVAGPLNIGSTGQTKAGWISAKNVFVGSAPTQAEQNGSGIFRTNGGIILNTGGAATGLIVDKGFVGIGTQSPGQLLNLSANQPQDAAIKFDIFSSVTGGSATFNYNTGAEQTWTVPPGVNSITVDARGAGGGGGYISSTGGTTTRAGKGARVVTNIGVSQGQIFSIYVGGKGVDSTGGSGAGGFNGGARGDVYGGGGGGGASDVRSGGNKLVIAGGGGGTGGGWGSEDGRGGTSWGGDAGQDGAVGSPGGGTSWGCGSISLPSGGGGGTQSAGGAGGSGVQPAGDGTSGGGGGGGGYFGGGGGGARFFSSASNGSFGSGGAGNQGDTFGGQSQNPSPSYCGGAGGGGGSSYSSGSGTTYTTGFQSGNGQVIFTYNVASLPTSWTVGIDQSDSYKFKISQSTALGTSDMIKIGTDGTICLGTTCKTNWATTPSFPGESVMYLRQRYDLGEPNNCPSNWTQADYQLIGTGGASYADNVRTCFRTDANCQVMYLRRTANQDAPNTCPSNWNEADYRTEGHYNNVRTCYRCQ